MKNAFYERVKERGAPSDVEVRLRKTVVKLKKTIASKNKELDQLRNDVLGLTDHFRMRSVWGLAVGCYVGRIFRVSADLVPDDLWERIAPLLPVRPPRR
ncbi:hypothetical protein ACFYY7_42490, partial [Streptomyces sp. NPDC001933]